MSEVNWDLAPEGAVALKQDVGRWKNVTWIHADGSWWDDNDATWNPGSAERNWVQTIAVRPVAKTKTVEDAVDAFDGEWNMDTHKSCSYSSEYDEFFTHSSSYQYKNGEYLVCTREQFEACAADKGEKWTHTYCEQKCRIIHTDAGSSWIVIDKSGSKIVPTNGIKPIKPTISQADCELLVKFKKHITDSDKSRLDDMLDDFLAMHDII